jgi:hypothetical protein
MNVSVFYRGSIISMFPQAPWRATELPAILPSNAELNFVKLYFNFQISKSKREDE